MQSDQVTVYAPSTIANLNVGFDALGLALDTPLERMEVRRISARGPLHAEPPIKIKLEDDSSLPLDPDQNVAGVAARSVLRRAGVDFGVELSVFKPVRPGSGLGSSAASAVAAAFGVSALLSSPLSLEDLLECALDGEEVASGSRHLDNVAPALYGGLCLSSPLKEMSRLPLPAWWIVLLRPEVTIRTADAREALPTQVSLAAASASVAWMGRFVDACHRRDPREAALALHDLYIGPARAHLIPALSQCRDAALHAGAISGGISGSGPTSFWVCLDRESAQRVERALGGVMRDHQLQWSSYLTQPSALGAHID